jgi:radical SAM superfamily enzyme YgiQ (UPF0313 family)
MRVGFYVQGFESLGVEYLSGVLKQGGHDTTLFFDPRIWRNDMVYNESLGEVFNIEDMLVEEILNDRLDMLCFSVVTDNYATALRVAAKVKKHRRIPIVFGGIHCTSVPERVVLKPQVDYVVIGEGEYPLLELCDALADGNTRPEIGNVWYQAQNGEPLSFATRPTISDLDSLPFPDKDVFYDNVPKYHQKHYIAHASRGCVYACTFCNNSMYKKMYNKSGNGRWHRRRTVDNLLEELTIAQKKYNYSHVSFWDEIFIDNREWLEEFCDKYPKVLGQPFWCYGYVKFIDEDVISMLEHANCNEMNIGVQTIRPESRRIIKRGDNNERIAKVMNLVRESRIYLTTGNILQLPGQPVEEAFELAEFYNTNPPDLPIVGYLRYYPRTEIVKTGQDMGVLDEADIERIEEAKEEQPFVVPQEEYEKAYCKAHILIQMSPWAPRWVIPWLLKTGYWKWLPTGAFMTLWMIWVTHLRMWITGKKHFPESYTTYRLLWVMAKYGIDKLRWKMRGGGKDPDMTQPETAGSFESAPTQETAGTSS